MVMRHRGAAADVRLALGRAPVVLLAGPRQSGKTTIARSIVPVADPGYLDLEDPADLARLAEPKHALAPLRGVVVIDEVQRRPDLFPVLRVLADRKPVRARFLLLGSASGDLLRQSSESLAGRIEVVELGGFTPAEVASADQSALWLRGGFPRAFLARNEPESWTWRQQFVRTFLERDLPQLGGLAAAPTLLRFWTMVAHYHGSVWSHAEPARSLGVSEPTIRRYLDLLTSVFMVRQLQPWHANLAKRQIKSPKVYIRDSGLLHQLLGIRMGSDLERHPKVGASWEGFVIESLLTALRPDAAHFWGTHQGAELDLLLMHRGRRYGVEIKRADAPVLTSSMRIALDDLALDHLTVVYPGDIRYRLGPRATTLPSRELREITWKTLAGR